MNVSKTNSFIIDQFLNDNFFFLIILFIQNSFPIYQFQMINLIIFDSNQNIWIKWSFEIDQFDLRNFNFVNRIQNKWIPLFIIKYKNVILNKLAMFYVNLFLIMSKLWFIDLFDIKFCLNWIIFLFEGLNWNGLNFILKNNL